MRLIAQGSLRSFWEGHSETEAALRAWSSIIRTATFGTMAEIQARFPKAKILNGERVRFEIVGGDYRLIAAVYFPARAVYVKFIGTHAEYDRIDALTVDDY